MNGIGSLKVGKLAKTLIFTGLLVGTFITAQSANASTKVIAPTSLTTCTVNSITTVVPTGTLLCPGTTDISAGVWTGSAGLVTADRPYLGMLRYCINNSTAVISTLSDGSTSITCKSTETQVTWTRTWGVPTAAVIRNVNVTGTTTAMVAYSDSTANNGSQIVKYVITATPGVNNSSLPAVATPHYGPGSPTMKITGLHADTDYSFVVCATNAAGTTCTKPSQTVHTWPVAPIISLSSSAETERYGTPINGYSPIELGGHSLTPPYLSTYSILPAVQSGLSFVTSTGLLSGTPSAVHAAITYTITETNISGSASATFTLTINPALLTVKADNKTKVYGGVDPTLTYSVTGYVLGESSTSFVGGLVRTDSNSHVGAYAITQGDLATGAGSNYVVGTFVPGTLTIMPAPLTVTVDNQTKVYGGVDPTLTYSVIGYVNGESSTSFVGGLLGTDVTTSVGKHAITQGNLATGADSNYAITVFNSGSLGITPAPITVTAIDQTKIYGTSDPGLTFSVDGYVNNESSTPFVGGLTREDGVNVGSYAITQGTLALDNGSNYEIVGFNPGTIEITARAITVTADNLTMVYGTAIDPALTYQVTAGSLATGDSFSGNVARDTGVNVGAYAITQYELSIVTGDSGNYVFTFIPGSLSITPAPLTVTVDNKTKVYGENDPALTYQVTGYVNGESSTSFVGGLVRVSGVNVGSYAITADGLATDVGSNYSIATFNPGTLSITARALTVKADNQSKTFGTVDPALTYIVTSGSLVTGDSFTGSLVRATGESVGDYTISQGGLAIVSGNADNYALAFVNGTFTISAAPVIVKTPTIGWDCGINKAFTGSDFHADACLVVTIDGLVIDNWKSIWNPSAVVSPTVALSHDGQSLDFKVLNLGAADITVTLTSNDPQYKDVSIVLHVHVKDDSAPTGGTVTF